MEGWISLHRKIRKNPIFNDHELLRLWLICLTEATHKERDQIIGRQSVHLLPGEFVTGRFDLEAMYNSGLKRDQQKSPKTVWRWLESLETGQYLTIKSTNKYSVVAVLNWHIYQSNDHDIDQQVTNKRPTSDQQVTTNNNVNKGNKVKNDNKNKETIVEIINYLNVVTGKSFSSDTKETIKLISGRLTEGRTLDQFKHVINVKTAEWLNSEKMSAWLKPNTLFAQSNFEAYLNQLTVMDGGQSDARNKGRNQSGDNQGTNRKKEAWEELVVGSPPVLLHKV